MCAQRLAMESASTQCCELVCGGMVIRSEIRYPRVNRNVATEISQPSPPLLQTQVGSHPWFDLVGRPEWCPDKIDLHILDIRKREQLTFGVAHDLRARGASRRCQRHVHRHDSPVNANSVDEA